MASVYKFKPYNVGRWVIWSLFALVLVFAPLVFTSNLSTTMLAQMGIAIIACLSYNMLLGQGGMLSFGHAVYTGLGSYMAIHALNAVSAGKLHIPVSLLPIIGGLTGMGFAILLGHPLCHDHAGCGRVGVCHVADVLGVFRGRGGCFG